MWRVTLLLRSDLRIRLPAARYLDLSPFPPSAGLQHTGRGKIERVDAYAYLWLLVFQLALLLNLAAVLMMGVAFWMAWKRGSWDAAMEPSPSGRASLARQLLSWGAALGILVVMLWTFLLLCGAAVTNE